MKYTLGILEHAPIKVGDFYVRNDFVILDMADDATPKLPLGGPSWPSQDGKLM